MEVKDYIIQESDKLFCQYGFKSVTMDDIAKHLGMSKKTIYQHFKDKDELVNILIKDKLSVQDCNMGLSAKNARDAVEEIFFAIDNMHELLTGMNPKLFYDLQKYHPKAWLYFKNFREKKLGKVISENLERGVKEGFYRKEIKIDILAQMRLAQVDIIFNQHDHYTTNKYTIAQVMIELTEHFLQGICNQKGIEQINQYKQKSTQAQQPL
ncbi:TetR/AcrR family transcriptional regulator [Pedobacter sp. UC225_65]|uniref:TetR/AcrR family transcriptional regulator n=1 Tax=Pedobacter sp. UC225_65 TaxID=3350173 RepID=UPI00366BE57F